MRSSWIGRRPLRLGLIAALFTIVLPAGATGGVIQDVRASQEEARAGEKLDIRFRLSAPAETDVTIYDADLGAVRRYGLGILQPGQHSVTWDQRDEKGRLVPPEAYIWRIEAKTSSGTDRWEPPELNSRAMEHIAAYDWDVLTRTLSYRTPAAMRIWVRIGIQLGATVRGLVEGLPRPAGTMAEIWDGLDESGGVNILAERTDWLVSIFGYRLPRPCVIVTGPEPLPERALGGALARRLTPSITPADPVWHRLRAFSLADKKRPALKLMQLDRRTFVAYLEVPAELDVFEKQILQRTLSNRIRLKWFIDGHCAAEDVDAVMPSMITLAPDQMPDDKARHFITANLVTAMHEIEVASLWIE